MKPGVFVFCETVFVGLGSCWALVAASFAEVLQRAEWSFLIFFTAEMTLKILAHAEEVACVVVKG